MATYQYRDLPQIPFSEIPFSSDDLPYMPWSQGMLPFRHAPTTFEDSYGYTENGSSFMRNQAVQRFLLDKSPLTEGLLHANLHHGTHHQHQIVKPYQQWPTPAPHRYDSPDRTSVSGNSSYATQTEARSPCAYPAASYGSPEEFVYSSSPYPAIECFKQESMLPDPAQSGGNVNLRDLELYNHEPEPEAEPVIEEVDTATMRMEVDGTYEPDPDYIRVEPEPEGYDASSGSTISHSLRDAESVQPMEPSEEESSDADYTPNRSMRRRLSSTSTNGSGRKVQRPRSAHGRKKSSTVLAQLSRVTKRGGRRASKVAGDPLTIDTPRHFPCPLAMYGCLSTFSSKNEWMRHHSTQHMKLGFWRCDLCPATTDPNDQETTYFNDFNRKDLFVQHLRRMHAGPMSQSHRSQKVHAMTEDEIADHQKRCYNVLRESPTRSTCLYCKEDFVGPNSWKSRMEHIGRHLEKDRKNGNTIGEAATWNVDQNLERWLREEGIIARTREGEWKIGDGRPLRPSLSDEDTSEDDA